MKSEYFVVVFLKLASQFMNVSFIEMFQSSEFLETEIEIET